MLSAVDRASAAIHTVECTYRQSHECKCALRAQKENKDMNGLHKELWLWCAAACLVAMVSGCGSEGESANPKGAVAAHQHENAPQPISITSPYKGKFPMNVVCTTGMVADLARYVGGGHVEVMQLMGEGIDPHLYRATPKDVSAMSAADLILYSGIHLEGKLADIFERMSNRKPTFAVTQLIPGNQLLAVADGLYDPHLWFDVALWSEGIGLVETVLCQFDPPHADEYKQNAESYRQELAALDEHCRTQLALIPEAQRVMVTAHDAFHYFGNAYGIEVQAIQGISTESEAGVKRINDLVDFIVDRNIKAVFVETSVANANIESLIEGCAARGHTVVIGGELFSDAMGKPGTPEGTYIGMIRHNVDTLTAALR